MDLGSNKSLTNAKVVVPFYILAVLSFTCAVMLLLITGPKLSDHYFQPQILAITHIIALGWGTSVAMGALFQFLPVLLDVKLYSEKLAKFSFVFLLSGLPVLIYAFWNFDIGWTLQGGALLVAASVLCFVINIYKTAASTSEWKISADFIVTSSFWLFLTVLAGTTLALNLRFAFLTGSHLDYLKLHAHLGLIGWFLLLIIGVSSRLIPMFLISQYKKNALLNFCYYLINAGLIGFAANGIMKWNYLISLAGIISIVIALPLYVYFVFNCYKTRLRKTLDIGMKQTLFAFVILMLPLCLLVFLSYTKESEAYYLRSCIAYGVAVFLGVISTLILGQIYKTLPFIIWLRSYSGKNANKLLPKDLYSERLAAVQFISHILSVMIIVFALLMNVPQLIRPGEIIMCISVLAFNTNIFKLLMHYIKPKHAINQ